MGVNEDNAPGYRDENEVNNWDDPLEHYKAILDSRWGCEKSDIIEIELEVDRQVNEALEYAKAGKFSDINEVYKDVLYG